MKYARAYNRALRFSADFATVAELTRQHEANPGDHNLRLALADALTDNDRHREAELVAQDQPRYLHQGQYYSRDPRVTPGMERQAQAGYRTESLQHSRDQYGNHGLYSFHVTPETEQRMNADVTHFLHQNAEELQTGEVHPLDAGRHFFRARNRLPRAFSMRFGGDHPRLRDAAVDMQPFTLRPEGGRLVGG